VELDWEVRIHARAQQCGVKLTNEVAHALAEHARAVLAANTDLHLTTITEPDEFIERHIGEAFEGATMLDPSIEGLMFDLGSGNGYPAFPLAAARPGLRPLLAEASRRKAAFLTRVVHDCGMTSASVLEAQIQRAADLYDIEPIRVLTSRAVGAWPKIVPRLAAALADDGLVLLWCGEEVETVARRVVWKKWLALEDRLALPGREKSWVWRFRRI